VKLIEIADEARLALANIADRATGLVSPTMRLGVTGLSRAGKTVFITAFVHNLVHGGRLPLFKAYSGGRIKSVGLEPQPDDAVPRFDYENHVRALVDERVWPESTRRVSELRLTIEFESASYLARRLGRGSLNLDLIDYPGEWLLDLPLLGKDYAAWSEEAITQARTPGRAEAAAAWLNRARSVDAASAEDETTARELAAFFTDYLRRARELPTALSTLPPGRFLMPGDLEGSPALTFAPLIGAGDAPSGSLVRMMARRYESYKAAVVKPFFRDHFARLDRQIVLVDALQALNGGPDAVRDLQAAMEAILLCFRPGRASWLTSILTRRIDRILVAATKADHLHHADHDRLEAILRYLLRGTIGRAEESGARVDVLAMAAIRATREATVLHDGQTLSAIVGKPLPGEAMRGEKFDGAGEIAAFPGDLPDNPALALDPGDFSLTEHTPPALQFLRFRPPPLERTAEGLKLSLPHIRLDRALDFLIGDYLA
jgi:predicted YcjX-like family ATPase